MLYCKLHNKNIHLHYAHVFFFTNNNSKNNYIENTKSYDSINKSRCLNTIRNQQEILATRAISYLLNLPDHITNYDFTYIFWSSLLAWVKEDERKLQNIHIEKNLTLITILKHLQLKRLHQIYNTSYTIFIQITNKDLIYLNLILCMNFLVRIIK